MPFNNVQIRAHNARRAQELDMQQVHRILIGSDKVKSEIWFKKWRLIWKE
jgi:hypothetical protein